MTNTASNPSGSPDRALMFRRAFSTAWPAMMESFFVTLAGMIDTMMVGDLGSYAISAVGLTAQPKFIGLTLFFGINVAVSALVARRKGEERREDAHEIVWTSILLTLILCAVITLVFVLFAPQMMQLAGSNADTHEAAVEYFRIIMGGIFFNVIFNYLLIGGHLGFPAWGIRGAAIATVLGSVVSAVMALLSLFRRNSYIRFSAMRRLGLRMKKECVHLIWRLAGTTSLENIAMRVGFLATALVAARLGTDEFAAHNVGMNVLGLGFSFADGMQVAAIALAGEALGAGKKEAAKTYGSICQRIGFAISVLLALLLFFGGRWFNSLFFREEHIIEMGVTISRWIMVVVLLQISQIIYTGCLRAAGDVRYTLRAALISVTGIRTVVTAVLVLVFHMGLTGVWLGILSDQLSRFILMSTRFRQGKWVNLKI